MRQRRFNLLDFSGGHTGPKFPRPYLCSFENHSTGGDHSPSAHNSTVHDHGSHSNQGSLSYNAAVNDGIVTDARPIVYFEVRLLKSAMEYSTILDVDLISNPDGTDIAAYDRSKPDAAVRTRDHIPDHSAVRREPSTISKGRTGPFDRQDDRVVLQM